MIRDDLKLWELFRAKYAESFYGREGEWVSYLAGIGCGRSNRNMEKSISCPDSYHRVYRPHFIQIPDELAFKFLILGLP
jgi:hypothetical protein